MRYSNADHHTALRTEVLQRQSVSGMEFIVAKLRFSKTDVRHSIHANPTSFSLSGLQTADLLQMVGFARDPCTFFPGGQCFAAWVPEDFPLKEFSGAFPAAYGHLEVAERHLRTFGLLLRDGRRRSRPRGDGHTSPASSELKRDDDDVFTFVMSWLEGGSDKGWTFHYLPKHQPLSPEVTAAIRYLGLDPFPECPYFDFEPCHWQFFDFSSRGDGFFDSNAQQVHEVFAQLKVHFSPGLKALALTHAALAPFGFHLFPPAQEPVSEVSAARPISKPRSPTKYEYDVAISFAGPQRDLAEALAKRVSEAGFVPFYDDYYPEQLWGKDLVVFFDQIYRFKSRFCVILVSQEYCERMWTNHERQSAQARALEQRGKEYILPIRADEVDLPGMPPTIGYLSLKSRSIQEIGDLLVEKLQAG